MMKISKTRKIIWGVMICAMIGIYVYRMHIAQPPEFHRIQLNASLSGTTAVRSAKDVAEMPQEVPVEVSGIGVHPETGSTAIFLVAEEAKAYMPIFVGQFEASAISRSIEGVTPLRPLTHELLSTVIDRLDTKITRVVVSSLENGTFKATLVLKKADGETLYLDARPSDSIALALLTGADLFVASTVMEQAGYKIEEDEGIPEPSPEPERPVPPRAPDAEMI